MTAAAATEEMCFNNRKFISGGPKRVVSAERVQFFFSITSPANKPIDLLLQGFTRVSSYERLFIFMKYSLTV